MTLDKHGALEKYVRTPNEELKLAEEIALVQTANAIAGLLTDTRTTRRQFAERVGVSEARIPQILCADSNPTVRALARIGHAVGRRMVITFEPPPEPSNDTYEGEI